MPVSAAAARAKASTRASRRRSSATSTGSGSSSGDQRANQPPGARHRGRGGRSEHSKHEPLDEQLLDLKPGATGAHCQPHADLAASSRRPCQQHAGDVGAGNEQHQADYGHQPGCAHRQDAARLRHEQPHVFGGHDGHFSALVGLGVGCRELLADHLRRLAASACPAATPSFSRPFTNIQRVPRRSSPVRPTGDGTLSVMPAGSTSSRCATGSHSSGVSSGTTPVNRRRRDADDGVGQAAQRQRAADDRPVGAVLAPPHAIGQHHDTLGAWRVVGGGVSRRPSCGWMPSSAK